MECSRKRGPYKRYLYEADAPIPRQTQYNWRQTAKRSRMDEVESASCSDGSYLQESADDADHQTQGENAESGNESDGSESERSESDENGSESGEMEEGLDEETLGGAYSSPALLYPGAEISEEMGTLLTMSLAAKHKLTYSALEDILRVICMHLPAGTVPTPYKSLYRLLKAVGNHSSLGSSKIVHRLCGKCHAYIQDKQACQNAGCGNVDISVPDDLFVELPVDIQIKEFFEGNDTI